MYMSIEIMCCYARADQEYIKKLDEHLALFQRLKYITFWTDQNIRPGVEWERELAAHLDKAQVILLLISPSFLASDYCYGKEMQQAMARHEQGEVCVIPIIVRPVAGWQDAPFGKLQALPRDAKPITTWRDEDEAFLNVAEGVDRVVRAIGERNTAADRQQVEFSSHKDLPMQTRSAPVNGDIQTHAPITGGIVQIGHGGTISVGNSDQPALHPFEQRGDRNSTGQAKS